jgi:anti-sigma B factor antagonist
MENIHKEILGLMGKIDIHCRDEDDVIVVDLAGQLDIYNSGDLELLVDAYVTRGYLKFAMNLEKVTYLDSSTISVFIRCLQKLGKMGGKLVLVGLNGAPKEVFDMAKLHDVFKISAEMAEALKQMEG